MYIEIGYNKDTKITKEEIDKQLDLTLKNLRESGIISDDMKLVDHETIIMDPAYVHIETETTKKIDDLKNEFSKKVFIQLVDMVLGFIIQWKILWLKLKN